MSGKIDTEERREWSRETIENMLPESEALYQVTSMSSLGSRGTAAKHDQMLYEFDRLIGCRCGKDDSFRTLE